MLDWIEVCWLWGKWENMCSIICKPHTYVVGCMFGLNVTLEHVWCTQFPSKYWYKYKLACSLCPQQKQIFLHLQWPCNPTSLRLHRRVLQWELDFSEWECGGPRGGLWFFCAHESASAQTHEKKMYYIQMDQSVNINSWNVLSCQLATYKAEWNIPHLLS